MICYCIKCEGGDLIRSELHFGYGTEETVKKDAERIHTWPKLGGYDKEFTTTVISQKEITRNTSVIEIDEWIKECQRN